MTKFKNHLKILRLDQWFKNVFTIVGIILAVLILRPSLNLDLAIKACLAVLISCLMSSVNYTVNAVFDAPFDALHSTKKLRPIPSKKITIEEVFVVAILILIFTMYLSIAFFGKFFSLAVLTFFLHSLVYNMKPLRLKDIPYVDVLVESMTNPIRLYIGWFAVSGGPPYPSFLIAIFLWFFGAFLMTSKRLAEIRNIGKNLIAYRKVFKWYSHRSLVFSMSFYSLASSYLFVYLAWQYNKNTLPVFPLYIIWSVWFFKLTFESDSPVKEPERIVERPAFLIYSLLLFLFLIFILFQ